MGTRSHSHWAAGFRNEEKNFINRHLHTHTLIFVCKVERAQNDLGQQAAATSIQAY